MCFANSDENIVEGCTRIKNYLEKERILRMRGLFTFCYSDEQMQKLEALG